MLDGEDEAEHGGGGVTRKGGPGFVYVCVQPGARFYKMGLSRDIRLTVRRYKTTLGVLTVTFFRTPNPEEAERRLFEHMRRYRVQPTEVFCTRAPGGGGDDGGATSEREALAYLERLYGPPARVHSDTAPDFLGDSGEPPRDLRDCLCAPFRALRRGR